jgi:acid stress chaperone HdeB
MPSLARMLKHLVPAVAILFLTAQGPAVSQVLLEMSQLKCKDYMEAPADRQELIAAWMSGYFNAARNQPIVDLKRFAKNKGLVEKYCKRPKNGNDSLMNAIRKVAF